ncbi:TIGR04222 domain-containing membrane protein [Novosphingobium album (ex Liu et al. 2023)]|uniref:TIGR04222 domain-containing membrane protein n=1 Tax=Novosphingobium album (ex Liu et al. 2023) TaxID=3031130 RepID=A0ABT5WKV1_9SPHN|nr:TIGR04222 domain-containing membrane protein [Novosphingobium album (ex Liu et al. 2023)]MDE8650336.1 TIGR04222 domain-containing membrane protein [Novosphingobium album (ex Liu et al. 2023)]
MVTDIFDLRGPEFLALYAALLALAILLGAILPRLVRPAGAMAAPAGAEEAAYLAGGADRLAESAVARLLSARALVVDGQRFAMNRTAVARSEVERAILRLPDRSGWNQVRRAIAPEAARIRDRLVRSGLLKDAAARLRTRAVQTAPYAVLVVIGLAKIEVGLARGKPVGILVSLVIVTAFLGVIRWFTLDARTSAGARAIKGMALEYDRMRRAPVREETGMAVALFGTTVLAGSPMADFHALRAPGSSSGDSGGSGCSGGGGGGCGGCGGGGD